MSRVVAVVQARMGSARLPGKVLRALPAGSGAQLTVLDWVMTRVSSATTLDGVVLATSTDPTDDELARYCADHGYRCFRGDLHDVLLRVHTAAVSEHATTVVRVTADCPLVDPGLLDTVVATHLAHGNDFTANRLPPPARRTYPVGLDVEVAGLEALSTAVEKASTQAQREHVMPYLYEVPGRFRVEVLDHDEDRSDVRWTIDTEADLAAVRGLTAQQGVGPRTSWLELLRRWDATPELAARNAGVTQKRLDEVDVRWPSEG